MPRPSSLLALTLALLLLLGASGLAAAQDGTQNMSNNNNNDNNNGDNTNGDNENNNDERPGAAALQKQIATTWAERRGCTETYVASLRPETSNDTSASPTSNSNNSTGSTGFGLAFVCLGDDANNNETESDGEGESEGEGEGESEGESESEGKGESSDDRKKFLVLWRVAICDLRNYTGVAIYTRESTLSVEPSGARAPPMPKDLAEGDCRVIEGGIRQKPPGGPQAWKSFLEDLRGEGAVAVANTAESPDRALFGLFEKLESD